MDNPNNSEAVLTSERVVQSAVSKTSTMLEAIKFAHSVFALPFALLGLFAAAGGYPGTGILVLVVVCMVCVRSVAMGFNRLADHGLDGANPRTSGRALVRGLVSRGGMWGLVITAGGLAIVASAFFGVLYDNWWPLVGVVPLTAWVCGYSYSKRFTWLSHFWLGSVLGLSPVAAAIAVKGLDVGIGVIALGVGVCFWTAGFDVIYSTADVEFDRRTGLSSIPARFGIRRGLWMSSGIHAAAFACFVAAGYWMGLGVLYSIGLGVTAVLLVVEHSLVTADDLSRVGVAFFTVNGVVSVFLSGMGILDIVLAGVRA